MSRVQEIPPFATQVTDAVYAHLDMRPRAVAGLIVSCAGRERCADGYRVERDGYAGFGVEFVAEGTGTVVLDGRTHRLEPGTLFCYGPRTRHVITTEGARPATKYFADFFGQGAAPLVQRCLGRRRVVRVLEVEATRRLFDELLREARKTHAVRPLVARAYLELILLKAAEAPPASVHGRGGSPALESLQRCEQLIEANYATMRGLADLARAARLAPSHVCRLYRRFGRGTPHGAVIRRKLDGAADLLRSQPLLVKEAAAAVGYDDALHFSRAFRRHFGCSPREFQRRHFAAPEPTPTRG